MYYNIIYIFILYVNLHLFLILFFISIFYIFVVNCIQMSYVYIQYISSIIHNIFGYVLMQFDIFMDHLYQYIITIVHNCMGNIIKIMIRFLIYVIVKYEIISISNDYISRNTKIVKFILTLFGYFLKLSFTLSIFNFIFFIRGFQDIKIN
jgi:hypothetical protein